MATDKQVEAALNRFNEAMERKSGVCPACAGWDAYGEFAEQAMRAALEAAEAAAWRPGTEGAPLDETPILVEVETDWGHRVHRVYWTEAVHGKGIGTWAVDDRKFGPHPLRGYTNIRCWRPLPSPPKDTPHG